MKNSNLSSKKALLFFKVFFFIIYTLLYAFEPCVIALFPFRLRHLQNMGFTKFVGERMAAMIKLVIPVFQWHRTTQITLK